MQSYKGNGRRVTRRHSILVSFVLFFLICARNGEAQELFSLTEPASNIASGAVGLRLDHLVMDEKNTSRINYHLIPELLVGLSGKLMVVGNIFLSNRTRQLQYEGGSLYAKYRFLSGDQLQQHFRMAVFGRLSKNTSDIHQEEINMYGHNTGFEAGIVATKLIRKLAMSSSASWLQAYDNSSSNKFSYGTRNSRAVNGSISMGKLFLPVEYKNYRQTNLNGMIEILSQVNTGSGKYFLDFAGSIQFIFNSRSRIDLGYKRQVNSTMLRTAPNGLFVRMEHVIFNAL